MEVRSDIGSMVASNHCALIPSCEFSFSSALRKSQALLTRDWDQLELDPSMSDGGKYRFRRYGQFRLSTATGQLTHLPEASYFQSIEANPLNGGKMRHFAPLAADTVENPFLHEIIRFDFDQLIVKNPTNDNWLIGVHQIRIFAEPGVPGNPTPEGSHRDDETYTSEHLIGRHNVDGGINYFYGSAAEPSSCPEAVWQQESYFDSYYFDRTLWHEVSPIVSNTDGIGYRDVVLIDFSSPFD